MVWKYQGIFDLQYIYIWDSFRGVSMGHLPLCLPALPMIPWGIGPVRRQQQRSLEAVSHSFLDYSKNVTIFWTAPSQASLVHFFVLKPWELTSRKQADFQKMAPWSSRWLLMMFAGYQSPTCVKGIPLRSRGALVTDLQPLWTDTGHNGGFRASLQEGREPNEI